MWEKSNANADPWISIHSFVLLFPRLFIPLRPCCEARVHAKRFEPVGLTAMCRSQLACCWIVIRVWQLSCIQFQTVLLISFCIQALVLDIACLRIRGAVPSATGFHTLTAGGAEASDDELASGVDVSPPCTLALACPSLLLLSALAADCGTDDDGGKTGVGEDDNDAAAFSLFILRQLCALLCFLALLLLPIAHYLLTGRNGQGYHGYSNSNAIQHNKHPAIHHRP